MIYLFFYLYFYFYFNLNCFDSLQLLQPISRIDDIEESDKFNSFSLCSFRF